MVIFVVSEERTGTHDSSVPNFLAGKVLTSLAPDQRFVWPML
jgi:hypothetical protein